MSSDITDELRLAAERERSRYGWSVLECAPDAMVIVNQAGEIQLANAATETLFGYGRAELVGRPVEMLIPERHRNRHPGHRAGFFLSLGPGRWGLGSSSWAGAGMALSSRLRSV
jgi:PAS domain-containing protein